MPPRVDLNEIWQSWDQWSFPSEGTFYMRFSLHPGRERIFTIKHCSVQHIHENDKVLYSMFEYALRSRWKSWREMETVLWEMGLWCVCVGGVDIPRGRIKDQGWRGCQSVSVIDRRGWQLLSLEVSPGPPRCNSPPSAGRKEKRREKKEQAGWNERGQGVRGTTGDECRGPDTFTTNTSSDLSCSCSLTLWWTQTQTRLKHWVTLL